MRIEELRVLKDQVIVELDEKSWHTESGLHVVRDEQRRYDPFSDFETGTVRVLGEGEWDPLEVGDRVIVRAESGGAAGSDVSKAVGASAGRYIVVSQSEVICVLGDS